MKRKREILLPLHNKSVFIAVILLLTATLTAINNHYYYIDREVQTKSLHQSLISTVDNVYIECVEKLKSADVCKNLVVNSISSSRWRGTVSINEPAGKELLSLSNQSLQKNRSVQATKQSIGPEESPLNISMETFVTPSLSASVVRSMTFSAKEILQMIVEGESKKEIAGFILNVAIPRSRPAFFYLLTMCFVILLVQKRTQSLIGRIDSLEEDSAKDLSRLDEQRDALINLQGQMEEKDRQLEASQSEVSQLLKDEDTLQANKPPAADSVERKLYEKEIQRVRDKLMASSVKNTELAAAREAAKFQYEKAAREEKKLKEKMEKMERERAELMGQDQPRQESIRRKLSKILLKNPDVPTGPLRRANAGKHHSKGYIDKLANSIEKAGLTPNVILSITSSSYNPRDRKTVQVKWLEEKKRYGLIVTSQDDEGYAAEIVLHATEYWHALLDAKYLLEVVRLLNGYRIK